MAANADGEPLLHTFQKHIEDMRSLVQCKICIKPLYEPFILSCGHSYCYSCLTSWFTCGNEGHRRRQNMKCPDCRAAVVLEPSPNYVLRDLVHMFISRTELLPEEETTDEHEMAKAEEAVQMTTDRNGVGLFKGAFHARQPLPRLAPGRPGPLYDPHDGVERCPECHWELEDGRCNQCEWSISDDDMFSDEDLSESDLGDVDHEIDVLLAEDGSVRRRFHGHFHSMSPTGSFLASLDDDRNAFGFHHHHHDDEGGSVITISSDVDDVDPVDHELAGTDADSHSEAESELPVAMGGRPRNFYRNNIQIIERELDRIQRRGDESDTQSTNYDDSEMGDTNPQTTSEMNDSDRDETEDDSSEMDGFVEHDTPTHIPHRVHQFLNANAGLYINSDDDDPDDETNTNREQSQALTTTTNASGTNADSSSEQSSEDESRRTPIPQSRPPRQTRALSSGEQSSEDESRRISVPQSRPSRQTRVILDDSDEDQGQSDGDDSNGDESDATTIPAQPTATRRSRLQNQRARRGQNVARRTLVSPPRRPGVPYSRGGFDNGRGRHHPYPLQATTSRRGMTHAYVAG